MIKFTKDKVTLLHELLAHETGGDVGVRDEALLESALENAYATLDNNELYPTKQEKAAILGFSLINNNAFVDGNKRIGMHVMIVFLEIAGLHIHASNEDVARVGLAVASGEMKYEDLLKWVISNTQ